MSKRKDACYSASRQDSTQFCLLVVNTKTTFIALCVTDYAAKSHTNMAVLEYFFTNFGQKYSNISQIL